MTPSETIVKATEEIRRLSRQAQPNLARIRFLTKIIDQAATKWRQP